MRWTSGLVLAVVLAGVFAARLAAQPPNAEPPRLLPIEDLEDADRETLLNLLARARQERDARRLRDGLRRRYPGKDLTSLEKNYGLRQSDEIGGLGQREFRRYFRALQRVVDDREYRIVGRGPSPLVKDYDHPEGEAGRKTVYLSSLYDPSPVDSVSQSVVAIVRKDDLVWDDDEGAFRLKTEPLVTFKSAVGSSDICVEYELFGKPSADLAGTGFLIDTDLVVTAAHVASTYEFLENHYFLFGYHWVTPDSARTLFDKSDFYEGLSVEYETLDGYRDAALVRLESAVTGYDPIRVATGAKIADEDEVYVYGHPHGLPQMRSGPGDLLDNRTCDFFTADVQVSPKSSGSPVVNALTGVAEGIANYDFQYSASFCDCVADATWNPSRGTPGVVAARIGLITDFLERPEVVYLLNGASIDALLFDGADTLYVGQDSTVTVHEGLLEVLEPFAICRVRFEADAGETWRIVDGDEELTFDMERCPSGEYEVTDF